MDLSSRLVQTLLASRKTISCCESFTGGLFGASLTEIPGVSSVFAGGLITYWSEIKEQVAGVPAEVIDTFGVVSGPCAAAMAEKTRGIFHTDLCVSFTGNAGPDAQEGKPAGLVYAAIASEGEPTCVFEWKLDCPRNELRKTAVRRMMHELLQRVSSSSPAACE